MHKMVDKMMEHIALDGFGGPEIMRVARSPRPTPGPDEVLIAVAYAGINRLDLIQRQGHYPPPPGVTDILGLEVAGEVVAIGSGVTEWAPGDRVCALVAGGGYASHVVAPVPQVLPVPQGLDLATAAAIPETWFTVWTNLYDSGRLQPGESLLVHAGASGIGTTAIQLAHALGAQVFTTVSTDDRVAFCQGLGAELAINYRKGDWVEPIRTATGGKGVDVILDMRGGEFFPPNLKLLAPGGRIVHIAWLAGRHVTLDIGQMMRKRAVITGTTLRPRSIAEKGAIAKALHETVWPLFESGQIRPQLDRILLLAEAAAAHRALEAGEVTGKLVLEI